MKAQLELVVAWMLAMCACRGGPVDDVPSQQPKAGSMSRKASPPPDGPFLKLWVSADGQIDLNGNPADLTVVEAALADAAKAGTTVLYGRDDAGGEPHANAMKIIELIVRNRLPVRLSTKRDYSDSVGPTGPTEPMGRTP